MKTIKASYASVSGNLHTEFFGPWLRTCFDYPSHLNGEKMAPWRVQQPVYGEIAQSHGVEAQA